MKQIINREHVMYVNGWLLNIDLEGNLRSKNHPWMDLALAGKIVFRGDGNLDFLKIDGKAIKLESGDILVERKGNGLEVIKPQLAVCR